MAAFRLADIKPTTTRVIIATYQLVGPTAGPDAQCAGRLVWWPAAAARRTSR